MIKGLLSLLIMLLAPILVFMILFIAIFTPEKDKYGNFTDPIEYWTNDTYFENNFNHK